MHQEYWKPVVGYEGLYEVSSLGRVRSAKGGILSQCQRTTRGRYWTVCLSKKGAKRKTLNVHRLVAEAFMGPRPDKAVITHGARGQQNNRVENLSYGSLSQNAQDKKRDGTMPFGERHPNSKMSDQDVLKYRQRHANGETALALSREAGVAHKTMCRAVNGETYAHLRERRSAAAR